MTTLTTLDILKKGRELIADPARWTQQDFAKDKDGNRVMPGSPEAVCFCSMGAIDVSAISGSGGAYIGAHKALAQQCNWNIAQYNDTRPHLEVIAAWDRAIAAEEAKQ